MFNPIIIASVLVDTTDSHFRVRIGGCEIRRSDARRGTDGLSHDGSAKGAALPAIARVPHAHGS